MIDEINFELPPNLPYVCSIETEAICHGKKCDHCGKSPVEVHYYRVRYPDDPSFLEWEAKGKNGPNRSHVAIRNTTTGGKFCSEGCATRAYCPVYLIWRLKGSR